LPAVVAQSSDTLVSAPPAANERRQAIWPFLVMPLVVLLVFYILHTIQQMPEQPPASAEAHSTSGAAAGIPER
jgi:hypothetical protein